MESNFFPDFSGGIPPGPIVVAWIIPAVIAVGSLVAGIIGQRKQAKENRKLAEYQNQANEAYLEKQLEYNTPKNQMTRWQEAGLNPHLVYGQGNPGNQSSPIQASEIGRTDYQTSFNQIVPFLNQSMMTQSQVQAIDAKTRQTYVMTELNRLQARVLEKNPLLDSAGFKAIIDALKSSAEIKASESTMQSIKAEWSSQEGFGKYAGMKLGEAKLFKELELLEQRFKLNELDAKLKVEVLTSKEFQNAILEVQKRWMTDAEVTPQHILQFIQLLLMKAL